jgi:ADP-heptose:LPS heptosyltransferase
VTKNRSIGFDFKESSKLYSDVIPGDTNIHYAKSQFELWHYFDKTAKYEPPKLFYISNKQIKPQNSILFWLGATGNKILSESLVISIIEQIENIDKDYHIAFGPHDEHIRERYRNSWKENIQSVNFDLQGIAKYFLDYRCIIMPDTGPMHLVAALDIPLVQVFVHSNVKQYGYTGDKYFIIDKTLITATFSKFVNSWIT